MIMMWGRLKQNASAVVIWGVLVGSASGYATQPKDEGEFYLTESEDEALEEELDGLQGELINISKGKKSGRDIDNIESEVKVIKKKLKLKLKSKNEAPIKKMYDKARNILEIAGNIKLNELKKSANENNSKEKPPFQQDDDAKNDVDEEVIFFEEDEEDNGGDNIDSSQLDSVFAKLEKNDLAKKPKIKPGACLSDVIRKLYDYHLELKEQGGREYCAHSEDTYVPSRGCNNPADPYTFDNQSSAFPLHKSMMSFIRRKDGVPIALLLAPGGGGKSTYGRYLQGKLWDEKSIPIFISLSEAEKHDQLGKGELVEWFLREKVKLNDKEVELLKAQKKQKIVFILDGFDEINKRINVYEKEKLVEWNNPKIILFSRPEVMDGGKSAYLFSVKRQKAKHIYIAPLVSDEIYQYMAKYVASKKKQNGSSLDVAFYMKHMDKLFGKGKFSAYPLAVKFAAEIMEEMENDISNEDIKLSKVYREFASKWFNEEARRLKEIKRAEEIIKASDQKEDDDNSDSDDEESDATKLSRAFADYSADLGFTMFKNNEQHAISQTAGGRKHSTWDRFFTKSKRLLLEGSPIIRTQDNHYKFAFHFLVNHFAALRMTEIINKKKGDIQDEDIPLKSLLMYPRENKLGVLDLIASELRLGLVPLDHFNKIIKNNSGVAAANAMMILNLASKSFEGHDLQGLNIVVKGRNIHNNSVNYGSIKMQKAKFNKANLRDAHLDYANFANASFKGADLRRASFIGCDLRGADLRGAKVEGANFKGAHFDDTTRIKDVKGTPASGKLL